MGSCGRCEGAGGYWALKDALDELQGLDPLRYFAEPVDEELEPTYRTVIPDPMDFATMRVKLHKGAYATPKDLADDFALLCRNALVFNTKHDNPFRRAAQTRRQPLVRSHLWFQGCRGSTQQVASHRFPCRRRGRGRPRRPRFSLRADPSFGSAQRYQHAGHTVHVVPFLSVLGERQAHTGDAVGLLDPRTVFAG